MDKKQQQLGMNPSTASHRLVKDILFSYVKDVPCYRCQQPLTRDTFSVEHKKAWLNSEDPVNLFFDLDNISYSHLSCNIAAANKESGATEEVRRERKRLDCIRYKQSLTIEEKQAKRKAQYQRTGK